MAMKLTLKKATDFCFTQAQGSMAPWLQSQILESILKYIVHVPAVACCALAHVLHLIFATSDCLVWLSNFTLSRFEPSQIKSDLHRKDLGFRQRIFVFTRVV